MSRPRFSSAVGLLHAAGCDQAPQVAVRGELAEADLIVSVARRYGIPVVEDAPLAKTLAALPIDEAIPQELYRAVAVLLCQLDAM